MMCVCVLCWQVTALDKGLALLSHNSSGDDDVPAAAAGVSTAGSMSPTGVLSADSTPSASPSGSPRYYTPPSP